MNMSDLLRKFDLILPLKRENNEEASRICSHHCLPDQRLWTETLLQDREREEEAEVLQRHPVRREEC